MRKVILCISVIILLLTGCSNEEEKQYKNKFDEQYLNLSVLDISNENDLSNLFAKESKLAMEYGYYAIIVEKKDTLKASVQHSKEEYGSYQKMYTKITAKAKDVNVETSFHEWKETNKRFMQEWETKKSKIKSYEAYSDLYVLSDNLYLALIPSENPYDVFAYLPMSNDHECPSNDVLLAVFKHWYEDYGIIPAIITYDSIHIAFTKNLSEKQLEQLAEEIMLLNSETQYETYTTKEDLVKGLKHSKYWMFRWNS